MKVEVNGKELEVEAKNVEALLYELDLHDTIVATALNQSFIRKLDRAHAVLSEGDQIEIVAPRQGG
jgi:sulfur carrier protein